MSAARDLYRRRLNNLLALAPDAAFVTMCWAANAMQSGRASAARKVLVFPNEVATEDMHSPWKIHPWELETLVNELLTVPKAPMLIKGKRVLPCDRFEALRRVRNALHGLENAEEGLILPRLSALRGMHRLSQRQFEWQRGFWNAPQLYRSAYVFGGPIAARHFEEEVGVPVPIFVHACMVLLCLFQEHSSVTVGGDAPDLPREVLLKVLERISLPIKAARMKATDTRGPAPHTGYKPSILRMHPCIRFGDSYLAPLPELIMLRGSGGIFYDVVSGHQNVRTEIGSRFETYCLELLRLHMPKFRISPEEEYQSRRGRRLKTPDIRLYENARVEVVLECKATRMTYGAKFSEDPLADGERGYKEIAKGVFQIWRFISHMRRGLIPGDKVAELTVGVVLTMDTWLSAASHLQREALAFAHDLADKEEDVITEADRIRVIFCPIAELETLLRAATPSSFLTAVRAAAEERYEGWFLSTVHDLEAPGVRMANPYPFWPRMGEVLPWWNKLSAEDGIPE